MTISFTLMTAVQGLDHIRGDAYFTERAAGIDDATAVAYRDAREHLKSYPSAIVFPEALLFLPACDLRRRVWAVDFEVVGDRDGTPAIVGSKVSKLEFFDLAAEHDLAMVYATPEEVVEADLAGIHLSRCRRLPWLDNAYDPVARLRLYLPSGLMRRDGAGFGFGLDAMFAQRADAEEYRSITNEHLWSSKSLYLRQQP